ncbi:Tumor suppressor p53-binding protein 1 [Melipona quadrifasciata]|uniref:Tumor suppressor p53-binding protein 1 n=1 Tax=Melipona quadrifasciata TaxID=166423 RepID=A0A0M9A7W9_9HYME|nr:Tumor suppressor p53-binding protein 1 [Melipona quadrifasciata]
MSETEKKESGRKEDQDTFSGNLEKHDISMSNSLNESQDFHLVDTSDDELQQNLENAKNKEVSHSVSGDNVEVTLNEVRTTDEQATMPEVRDDDVVKVEDTQDVELTKRKEDEEEQKTVNKSSVPQSEEKYTDEDDEIIQCTPPAISSPSKKQIAANVATSLKRKAESFDEPPTKIFRTASKEGTPTYERRIQEEEESCHSFKSDNSHHEFPKSYTNSSVIIAETQDVEENEDAKNVVELPATYKERARDEKQNPELGMKDYEIDKNKNFNDASKLYQAITKRDFNDEISEVKDTSESSENRTTQVEKDSTSPLKAVAVEKLKPDLSNKNTDGTKPIEMKDIKVAYSEKTEDKENGIDPARNTTLQQNSSSIQEIPGESSESHSNMCSSNISKSRKSIELLYDQTTIREVKPKSTELVEIDEDGEKIVLDSSQEESEGKTETKCGLDNTKSDTIYKSCFETKSSSEFSYKSIENTKESSIDLVKSSNKLVNGSSESKKCDTDSTTSVQSDTFNDMPVLDKAESIGTVMHNASKQIKAISVSKDSDHADLLSVSDNEPDVFIVDDKSKSNSTHSSSITKALQMEKEIGIYVRMKCLLHIDESTKEYLSKEITNVQCETVAAEPILSRQKNNDTSASLADISGNDNKEASPGSVNSNPQLYQLNPSRLSFASTISSLSSVSSAASLAAKLAIRDNIHFSLPRAPAKHAKRRNSLSEKQAIDETYERLNKEWQNSRLLTTTILNFANAELAGTESYSLPHCNISHERIDDQLQKIRCSTPEVQQDVVQLQTPKSTKKSKVVKRPRSKAAKSDDQSNGVNKIPKVSSLAESNSTPNKKKSKTEHTGNVANTVNVSTKPHMIADELIGKDVFAKWSDNNYYPGTVIDKIKMKYKVNFYDGKNKILIEDFVIPIPKVLREGLSVYAATKNYDYGSCGIIVHAETIGNEMYYTVETDEGEKLRVQIKDLSLSADQAQVLKEEINLENKSVPSTPKHLGQITLDNMVDGKRRSKRISTPSFSTPKSRVIQIFANRLEVEPSVSGVTSTIKKERKVFAENDGVSSDSNVSVKVDSEFNIGIQPEIIGTPYEQVVKGPQSRIKSKSRSKKKVDDEETIATFGPIPHTDSNLFKGMSFLLTCVPLESIDRFQDDKDDKSSDPGTSEDEVEWSKKPFIRDRLTKQIVAGGGKVYVDFNEIPQEEYKNMKLITNVPNTTAKALLCLSVGIPVYNHNWIIRCCQEGKLVNPAENGLPAGWSLEKNAYIEMFQRPSNKPLTQVVVIIPVVESEKQFAPFWRQICENAGAVVILADKPDAVEIFEQGTVVLTNSLCPSWAVDEANKLQIPLLSTIWIVQCLIEGKLCPYDGKIRYKYNYKKN